MQPVDFPCWQQLKLQGGWSFNSAEEFSFDGYGEGVWTEQLEGEGGGKEVGTFTLFFLVGEYQGTFCAVCVT